MMNAILSLKKHVAASSILLLILVCNNALAAELSKPDMMKSVLDTGSIAQMIGGLMLVVVLIAALTVFLKKIGYGQFKGNEHIKCVAGISLGNKERILLLQAGGKQLLIGVGQGSIQTLHVFDESIVKETKEKQSEKTFVEHLRKAISGRPAQ